MVKHLTVIVIITFCFTIKLFAQEENKNLLELLEEDQGQLIESGENEINNYDHWTYSDKKHAWVIYYAPMFQYGFNKNKSAYQFHHDVGINYRWFMVDNEVVKINFQGWMEFSQLLDGKSTRSFSNELGIISSHNGSSTSDYSLTLESFYFESYWLDGKLDLTIGRFDPIFFSVFTNYSGWDKYNYFSKTAASNPVPTLGSGMGVFTEYKVNDQVRIGGMVVDDQPQNDFLYIPDFGSAHFNFVGFTTLKFPGQQDLYSEHHLAYYYAKAYDENPSGNGIIYTANQGISENLILVIKASYGTGRIDKLNGAYAVGITHKWPFQKTGDLFGIAAILNEKASEYEYGMDVYYKYLIKRWINVSANLQVYYGINDQLNYIPGFRLFLAY